MELFLQDVEPVTPREEAGAVAEDAALNISSLHYIIFNEADMSFNNLHPQLGIDEKP